MPEIREILFFIMFLNYFISYCASAGSPLLLLNIWIDALGPEVKSGTLKNRRAVAGHVFKATNCLRSLIRGHNPQYKIWPSETTLPGMARSDDWQKENLVLKAALSHPRLICLDFGHIIFRVSAIQMFSCI